MKRITCSLIVLFCFLSFTLISQNVKLNLNSNSSKTELTVLTKSQTDFRIINSISHANVNLKTNQNGSFYKFNIESYNSNPANIGKADLPVINKLIEIPHSAVPVINIISYDEETIYLSDYGINEFIYPVQQSYSKSEDPSNMIFQFNNNYYQTDQFTNAPLAAIEELGSMREIHLGRLTISPIRYNPVQNVLKIYNNLVVEVIFDKADLNETKTKQSNTYSPFFEKFSAQLINYTPNTAKDQITQYPVKFVIVADPMFQSQLQPYIQWKTRKGFNVIEAYTNNAAVGSTTSSIKSYLQGLYNAGTPSDPAPSFVLLVGDVAQVPTWSGTTSSHKTDLYYVEYTGDFFPDVYLGRFSAQNTTQLQPQIDKTLMYEQYTMPDPSYLAEVLLVAGVDVDGGANTYSLVHGNGELEYGIDNYFNAAHGITVDEYLYPASENNANDPLIRADFNDGVAFANYTAHCSSVGWANPSFTTTHVPSMTNDGKYGLMVGNCCQSNTINDNECFGEAVLRKANGGAVGYIGGTNYSYWDEDYHWGVGASNIQSNPSVAYNSSQLGAYDRAFHDHGEAESEWFVTNAAFNMAGNLAVEQAGDAQHNYYWEIYQLSGDPSVMNYFGVPPAINANYTDPIVVGTTSLTVTTEQYAYVAISQNNVLLDAQYTGSGTSVTLTFPAFMSPGTADVVVTKQNRAPYIGTVEIISVASNNDAMLMSVDVPVTVYDCVQDIQPQVTIRNMGTTNLTSCNVSYNIDGGSPVTVAWTGNLTQFSTDVVTFPTITLTSGNHTFTAYTSSPNSVADEYTANDTQVQNYNVSTVTTTASFTADELMFCSVPATVNFTNTSTNALTYLWDFGDGNTSTAQDPSHTYTVLGDYTVTLTATNGVCGSDVDVQTNYISIDPNNPCEYIMPTSGTVTETACNGTLFDSGGPTAAYGNNENGILVISPVGASSVSVTFNSFDVEAQTTCGYDYLEIHDGVGTGTTSMGKFCNGSLPTGTYTSTGGSITIHFYSDNSVTNAGFEMDWSCTLPTTPPVAGFVSNTTSTCTGIVEFTDLSTNAPDSWLWDFGDGNTSTSQNPIYTYTTNGTYTVSLTATNAYGNDTHVENNLIVVSLPVAPTTTNDSRCGTGSVTLTASGTGTLDWYDAATGGNLVNTGNTFTTPSLSSTTTYYVEDHIANPQTYYVGETNNVTGGSYFTNTQQHGLIFNCTTPFTLVSVEVKAGAAGNRTIQLQDESSNVIATTTINIPSGTSRITLNFDVPVGNNLKLLGPGSPNLFRNNAGGLGYPYEVPGVVSIHYNTASDLNYYYYFYDWEIVVNNDCISSRSTSTATIETLLPVDVTVNASSTSVCTGDNVTFNATPTNGGTSPTYQWQVNGTNAGTGSTYSSTTLNDGDVVTCILTSSELCNNGPVTSTPIAMTVASSLPVSVNIAGNNTICAGETVVIDATSNNSGPAATYEWFINGSSIGNNNSNYTSTGLVDGDVVTCVVTSSLSCATGNPATSNALTITVNPNVNVALSISGNNSICAGDNVTFTSTPSGEGTSPTYDWQVNGTSVGSGASYSTTSLSDGDVVTCILTSSEACNDGPANSNAVTMTVNTVAPVSVVIAGNTAICDGDLVSFTAMPTNGGTPSYEWFINGSSVGAGTETYSTSTLNNGDIVSCVLTSSELCASGNPASSNQLTVTVEELPIAGFYYATNFLQVTLTNNSSNATSYLWDFGDGNTSTDQDPIYTYAADGTYTIILIATNSCGNDTSEFTVNVIGVGVAQTPVNGEVEIYPNPTKGLITLDFNSSIVYDVEIYDVIGKKQYSKQNASNELKLNLSKLNKGVYFIKLIDGYNSSVYKVVLD